MAWEQIFDLDGGVGVVFLKEENKKKYIFMEEITFIWEREKSS